MYFISRIRLLLFHICFIPYLLYYSFFLDIIYSMAEKGNEKKQSRENSELERSVSSALNHKKKLFSIFFSGILRFLLRITSLQRMLFFLLPQIEQFLELSQLFIVVSFSFLLLFYYFRCRKDSCSEMMKHRKD